MPNMDDLSARMEAYGNDPATQDHVSSHIDALADKLGEANEVVAKLKTLVGKTEGTL
jgi:hypothetical protein